MIIPSPPTFERSSSWAEPSTCPGTYRTAVSSTPEQHSRMEHLYRSDGRAHRIPFRRTHPADPLDATNKVKIAPEFLLEFAAKAHSPLGRVVVGVLKADREIVPDTSTPGIPSLPRRSCTRAS